MENPLKWLVINEWSRNIKIAMVKPQNDTISLFRENQRSVDFSRGQLNPCENAWAFTYLPCPPPMYIPFAPKSFCYDGLRHTHKYITNRQVQLYYLHCSSGRMRGIITNRHTHRNDVILWWHIWLFVMPQRRSIPVRNSVTVCPAVQPWEH